MAYGHMKKPNAYKFWYQLQDYGHVEYVYAIAYTDKQASYFFYNFLKQFVGKPYDYDYYPCDVIEAERLRNFHYVGEIVGANGL